MLAREAIEGQIYVLPSRFGNNIHGINTGWNYNKEFILFLLENGKSRTIRTVMPQEELGEISA